MSLHLQAVAVAGTGFCAVIVSNVRKYLSLRRYVVKLIGQVMP